METEKVVLNNDYGIFRRIFSYLRSQRLTIILALSALVISTAAELVSPIILQRGIDRTIIVEYLRIPRVYENDPAVSVLLESGTVYPIDGYIYFLKAGLSEISGDEAGNLEERGMLERDGWYVFADSGDLDDVLRRSPELFIRDQGMVCVSLEDLKSLSAEELVMIRSGDLIRLRRLCVIFFVILTAGLAASFCQVYLMAYTGQNVMMKLRSGLFDHLIRQSLSFLNKKPVGSLVTRATNDVETINDLFAEVATSLLKDLALMGGVLAALIILSHRLAGITLLSLPPVLILTFIFRSMAREAYRRVRMKVSAINTYLSEHITGMEIVQMFAREKDEYRSFEKCNREMLNASLKEIQVYATFRPLIDLLASVSVAVVLYWGARLFGNNTVSLGVLIAYINLVEKFYHPLKDISEQFTILQSAMAGGERVFQTLDEDIRIPSGEKNLCLDDVRGEIEFRDVSFSYNPGEQVLKGISLRVAAGETAALVGYTGAGKTTIANMITRLWDRDEGIITLDGRDIREYSLESLRRAIQPVDQDVFIFSGTIADNIRLGHAIDDSVVIEASRAVFLHDFIQSLPKKYDTDLAEGGVNLSAGQQQLLSFARVLAYDPRVIILDEATSNIDTKTEYLIQEAMKRVMEGRTSLVIAHRLSTIRNADRIFVLSDGRLIEEGTHEELLEKRGAYYNLYRLQYRGA